MIPNVPREWSYSRIITCNRQLEAASNGHQFAMFSSVHNTFEM